MLADLLHWKAWCLDEMYIQNKDVKLLYEIEKTLLLMEDLWVRYTNESVQNKQQYNSCGYVSSPYSNLVKNYYNLYKATGQKKYIDLFYKYDEKSKYSALLETLYKEKKSSFTNKKELLISKLTYLSFEDLTLKLNDKLELKGTEETYKKRFETHFGNYSATLKQNDLFSNSDVIPLQTVQKNLQKNEAILSYNMTGIQSYYYPYVFLITKFKTQIIDLKPERDYDAQIPKVDSLLLYLNKNDRYNYKKIAFKYYKNYFKPIEQYLPKTVKHIQIVPNSNFSNLPFDLLLNQESPTNDYRKLAYLGKKYQFSYALSASISRFANKTVAPSNNFSVISPSFDSAQLSELSFAKKSAKTITNEYNADLIKDTKATKKSFSEHLVQDKVVTLLSHGRASIDQDETQKGIYLSDGFLSLNEVYNLKSNCEFLILGSCESGEGYKENSEGNINLARAFTAIGVKSMMLSSWKIDEVSSTQIITSFFDYLSQGLTKSEALQKAKMDFLASANPKTASPIYWAGLNIIGNNDTIELRKNNSIYWWSVLFVFLLAGGFLYYRRRKKSN
jgi:CHAT domain-containing protein